MSCFAALTSSKLDASKLRSQGLAADSSKLQRRASGRARLRQVLLGHMAATVRPSFVRS